jgi:hypothetical protein
MGGGDLYSESWLSYMEGFLLIGCKYRVLMGRECRLTLSLSWLLYKGSLSVRLSIRSPLSDGEA